MCVCVSVHIFGLNVAWAHVGYVIFVLLVSISNFFPSFSVEVCLRTSGRGFPINQQFGE